ncbi:hypothetical protein BDV96DRAFT_652645 [Lophiotrema nucula]|uniref:Uncharacterized protein n=1 Tax=Lophiotrema nucula TaxID=690887 RepID=A0A6A5YRK7_9PLEO|nr:hypothetical protein BDV96DRAFT_652645 [Lophiotrema nucula]
MQSKELQKFVFRAQAKVSATSALPDDWLKRTCALDSEQTMRLLASPISLSTPLTVPSQSSPMEPPSNSFDSPFNPHGWNKREIWPTLHSPDRVLNDRPPPHWRPDQFYDWKPDGYPVIAPTEGHAGARQGAPHSSIPWFIQRHAHPSHASRTSWTPFSEYQRAHVPSEPLARSMSPAAWAGGSDDTVVVEGYESGYAETISGSDDDGENPPRGEDEAQNERRSGDRASRASGREDLECQHGEEVHASEDKESSDYHRSDATARWRALDDREARLTTLELHLTSKARDLEIDRQKLERERDEFETRVRSFNEDHFQRAAAESARRGGPMYPSAHFGPRLDNEVHGDDLNDGWDVDQDMHDGNFGFDDVGEYRKMWEYQHMNPGGYQYPYRY